MAIDTAAKRRIWSYPYADGTIGASDRVHYGLGYSGITIGGAPAITPASYYYMTLLAGGLTGGAH